MKVAYRPSAARELLEAQLWYEARSPGLGLEFARPIEAAVSQAMRMPLAFPVIETGLRRVMVRRFPYWLIYAVEDDQLVVISCFHHRRRPPARHRGMPGT